ncbi:transmembrane amino acid transporter protein-domain-containing protein [Dichotomocladium elegans]|nr:transmembrane amino acid transporter protein-domain-containing protein [Dichotomocladium elegans]
MSSPLPVNAKLYADQAQHDGLDPESANLSSSFDRASSTARLGTSPIPSHVLYSSSPARSTNSIRTYGSISLANSNGDLERVASTQSLFRPLSNTTLTVPADESQVAKAVKRHLIETSPVSSVHNDEYQSDDSTGITSVHQLPGGSFTHDIYKWTEAIEKNRMQRKRSRSVVHLRPEPSDPSLARLKDPGGFRRHFVVDRATRQGRGALPWMTSSFVEFLALYGHFGGEDLSEDEDDDEGDLESSPLLAGQQPSSSETVGTASPSKAVFLLLKSFVGTGKCAQRDVGGVQKSLINDSVISCMKFRPNIGVMFLPKAFANGGLIFSSALLTAIAVISLYSFLLLVETRNKVPMSFGDIGGFLFGSTMRMAVLFAITISQIGFVCAYMVFVAQNLQALVGSLFDCNVHIPIAYLILCQIAIFVPLAMVRKIQKLSAFALIADLFILIGLVYLYYYDFVVLTTRGVGKVTWTINPTSFPLFIGTAVFTYEGVGLVIPITESMKDPKKFPAVLSGTMVFITALFLSVGFISYLAFGEEVQTVILLNLPPGGAVDTVQGLYAMAICLSIPLQLFPAIRIMENGLFTRSGKHDPVVKWQKNAFRFAMVLVCAVVAIAGSADLDKFVSLIGSVCCVPLCFLFPPLFHYKGVAETFRQKFIDVAIIIFGVVSMVYTTFITVSLWSSSSEPAPVSGCIPGSP